MLTTSASLVLGFAFVLLGCINVWLVLEAWSRVKTAKVSSYMLPSAILFPSGQKLAVLVNFHGVRGIYLLAGCGKTPSFEKSVTRIMSDRRQTDPKLHPRRVSVCICGSFCPLAPRAGTLLP